MAANRPRLVGLSVDVMGTVIRVKGGSVGRQYQRVVQEAYLAEKTPSALLEATWQVDGARLDRYFKPAFVTVSERWPSIVREAPAYRDAVGEPTVGGANAFETEEFWRHSLLSVVLLVLQL